MTYTIDFRDDKVGLWHWRLYDQGGTRFIAAGGGQDIEGALAVAENQLLIHHRATLEENR